ncbi:MAG: hypothetical protein J0M12_15370 [Deltaproteobacteria bacterium]|nr:hypothetical protein [Deltaproteobacteria bacterium]
MPVARHFAVKDYGWNAVFLMVTLFLFALSIVLTITHVVVPTLRARNAHAEREFKRRYKNFKLYSVKKYHPAFRDGGPLSRLSYDEIRESYNLDECYEQIN